MKNAYVHQSKQNLVRKQRGNPKMRIKQKKKGKNVSEKISRKDSCTRTVATQREQVFDIRGEVAVRTDFHLRSIVYKYIWKLLRGRATSSAYQSTFPATPVIKNKIKKNDTRRIAGGAIS